MVSVRGGTDTNDTTRQSFTKFGKFVERVQNIICDIGITIINTIINTRNTDNLSKQMQ